MSELFKKCGLSRHGFIETGMLTAGAATRSP